MPPGLDVAAGRQLDTLPEDELVRVGRHGPRLGVTIRRGLAGLRFVASVVQQVVGQLHRDDPAQLRDRVRMVLDPHVEQPPAPGGLLGFRGDDHDRRRLAAADVAALPLGGLHGTQHPLHEGRAFGQA